MAYQKISYNEVMAWSETLLSYAISTDNGETWTQITEDEASAWYDAQGYNAKTTSDEESARYN